MSTPDTPERRTSYHVDEQFRVRASSETTSVEAAWERGLRIDVPDASPVPRHDEARYDARGDIVVFRREQTLTTCYGLRPAFLTNIYGIAVAATVDREFGTSYCTDIDPRVLEESNR